MSLLEVKLYHSDEGCNAIKYFKSILCLFGYPSILALIRLSLTLQKTRSVIAMKASVLSVLFIAGSVMSACTDPKVTASSYTPADSQVLSAIPFIAEFSLVCGNGEKPALYADIEGVLTPVTQSIEGEKYQVSDHSYNLSHSIEGVRGDISNLTLCSGVLD